MTRSSLDERLALDQKVLKCCFEERHDFIAYVSEIQGISSHHIAKDFEREINLASFWQYPQKIAEEKEKYFQYFTSKVLKLLQSVILEMRAVESLKKDGEFDFEEFNEMMDKAEKNFDPIHRISLFFSEGISKFNAYSSDIYIGYIGKISLSLRIISYERERIFGTLGLLDDKRTIKYYGQSTIERLERLTSYARANDDARVANYAAVLFPEWATIFSNLSESPSFNPSSDSEYTEVGSDQGDLALASAVSRDALPSEAPLRWRDRNPGETPPDFVRRVYGKWAVDGDGIGKRVLRRLDSTLVMELNKWVREGNEMPSDIKILTLSEENSLLLNSGPEAISQHLGKFTGAEALREASRLRGAQERRK